MTKLTAMSLFEFLASKTSAEALSKLFQHKKEYVLEIARLERECCKDSKMKKIVLTLCFVSSICGY